jgi:hypothetical protein
LLEERDRKPAEVLRIEGRIELAALGLLIGDFRTWLGWVTLGADVVLQGSCWCSDDALASAASLASSSRSDRL